jgi:hypothetical protein
MTRSCRGSRSTTAVSTPRCRNGSCQRPPVVDARVDERQWHAQFFAPLLQAQTAPLISHYVLRSTTASANNGLGQRPPWRPTHEKTLHEGCWPDAEDLRPLGCASRLSAVRDHPARRPIPSLLLRCRPSAVVWGVAAFIVATLDRCAGGRHPHVGQKCGKVLPSTTECDATTSVPGMVLTSSAYPCPNLVCARAFSSPIMSMFHMMECIKWHD